MAELWQAYGNWILFALFFIFMIGHHLFMGHGGHGTRGTAAGGLEHGEGHGEGHTHGTGGIAAAPRRSRRSGGCH